jgi:excisionase family DNA binding protein
MREHAAREEDAVTEDDEDDDETIVPPGQEPSAETGLPAILVVAELAAFMRVDRKTVYELIAAGTLPGVRRCGRSLRIHRDTVLRWFADGQGRAPRSRRHS